MQKCTRVHARGSGLTLFLLGVSCLELGSSQGPQMDQGSMKGNTSPSVSLGFMQRNWFCKCGTDEGRPHSEPGAPGNFQRPPVLLHFLSHLLRSSVTAASSCEV